MAEAVGVSQRVFERPKRKSALAKFARNMRRKPLGAGALVIVVTLWFVAVFAPLVAPYDPIEISPHDKLKSPRWSHPLGTDQLGRDVMSRLVYGARISIWVGVMAVFLGLGGGLIIGLTTGYFGGPLDLIVQRLVDALQAFPALILALVMVTVLGPGVTNMMLALGVTIAPSDSRVIRSAVLSIKSNTYVEAGRAVGVSNFRMLRLYILPNIMAPVIILASLLLATAILLESSLSFLGLGVQPPTPSWGNMLSAEGRRYMELAPWLAIFPGASISICVLGYNLFGDTLRDILDPRLRGS